MTTVVRYYKQIPFNEPQLQSWPGDVYHIFNSHVQKKNTRVPPTKEGAARARPQ